MEEYTLDEIIEELAKRYPFGIIFAGARPRVEGKMDASDFAIRFRGISFACLGLTDTLRTAIICTLVNSPISKNPQ